MNNTIEKFPQPPDDSIDYQASAERAKHLQKSTQSDLLPLERETVPAKSFPFGALGAILGEAAERAFEVVKAPDGVVGNSFLAAASLAVQGYADVIIDGRTFPTSLFVISVSDSGERKSGVDRVALLPFYDYQKYLYQEYFNDRKFHDILLEKYNADRSAAFKLKEPDRSKQLDALLQPEAPKEPIFICEEPTWEGLLRSFDVGQPYMGIFSDEGSILAGGYSLSAEKRLKMFGGLSKLWDGMAVSNVRKGDPALILYDKRLSLHLMMQPIVLRSFLADGLADGQGWLARCLIASPEPMAGKRIYDATNLKEDPKVKAYHLHVSSLLDVKPAAERRLIALSSVLHEQWLSFYNYVEKRLAPSGDFLEIKPFASKAPEQALRIAATLTLFENPEAAEISSAALGGAICLMKEYYLPSALALKSNANGNKEISKAKLLGIYAGMQKRAFLDRRAISKRAKMLTRCHKRKRRRFITCKTWVC